MAVLYAWHFSEHDEISTDIDETRVNTGRLIGWHDISLVSRRYLAAFADMPTVPAPARS